MARAGASAATCWPNYSATCATPGQLHAEYSYDIDFVAPGAPWPATDHPPEDALYVQPALPRTSSRTTNRTAERRMSYADRQRGWRDPAPARACGAPSALARAPHLAHDAVHGDAVAQRHFARRQVFHAAGQQDAWRRLGRARRARMQDSSSERAHLRRTRRVSRPAGRRHRRPGRLRASPGAGRPRPGCRPCGTRRRRIAISAAWLAARRSQTSQAVAGQVLAAQATNRQRRSS